MDKLDSLFNKLYKPLKKASKDDVQTQLVMDCIFYIHTCIQSRRGEKLLDEIDMSGIEFEVYSESESDEEMSESESDEEMSDVESDVESDVSSEDSSDDEKEVTLSRENLTQVNRYINKLVKAKIFTQEIEEIVIGSDDVTISGILCEVQDILSESVSALSKYLNYKESDFSDAKRLLESALVDLDLCYESVGYEHEEQLYLLKDRVHWIVLMLDMDNDEIKKELKVFDIKGLKLSR